jgi:predicted DCC family thiol-disulfide oxidoreductase YuxK
VAKIKQLDKIGLVHPIPITDPNLPVSLPPRAELEKELHVIMPDATIYKGANAVARLASLFPQTRWIGLIISLPLIRSIARAAYRIVARYRMKIL